MAQVVRVPITNIYGGGDYTAQIAIGSDQTVANVIMDTGSSTLAVVPKVYDPSSDAGAKPTAFAQDVVYGTGGWTGPVVTTTLGMGSGAQAVSLDTYIALSVEQEAGNFGQADGILGLAYNALNSAYDLSGYLSEQGVATGVTYPWPFRIRNSSAAIQRFANLMSRMPVQDLPPYFTALANAGIETNMFAFYTLRSVPSARSADPASDTLNQGYFVLGGGLAETDLFTGEFVSVDVVDDFYYNTQLLSVQVGQAAAVAAQPLPAAYQQTMKSNSIVDSGTNSLYVAVDVYNAIIGALQGLGATFADQINAGTSGSVPAEQLQLANWPNITFTLQGETGSPVALTCSPSTYWQVDAPQAGQATFMINNGQSPQSILGLPLMNNYFTVFDRTQDAYGAVRFAPIASKS